MVSRVSESFDPNGLLGGDFPRQGRVVTIASSAALAAGAVLGRVTASGKYLLSAAGASDGSQVPSAVLAEAADASGGDVQALVYFSGAFADAALSFGAGASAATVEAAWRAAQAPLFVVDRTAL